MKALRKLFRVIGGSLYATGIVTLIALAFAYFFYEDFDELVASILAIAAAVLIFVAIPILRLTKNFKLENGETELFDGTARERNTGAAERSVKVVVTNRYLRIGGFGLTDGVKLIPLSDIFQATQDSLSNVKVALRTGTQDDGSLHLNFGFAMWFGLSIPTDKARRFLHSLELQDVSVTLLTKLDQEAIINRWTTVSTAVIALVLTLGYLGYSINGTKSVIREAIDTILKENVSAEMGVTEVKIGLFDAISLSYINGSTTGSFFINSSEKCVSAFPIAIHSNGEEIISELDGDTVQLLRICDDLVNVTSADSNSGNAPNSAIPETTRSP